MTTTVTCYIRQARPSDNEVQAFWKLYRAADRIDHRWGGFTIPELNEELQKIAPDDWNEGIDRAHRLFLLRAYQVLVRQGGFGRFMGAFDTMAHNMQDPNADTVDWKPEIKTAFMDGDILPVVLEAYEEARQAATDAAPDDIAFHTNEHGTFARKRLGVGSWTSWAKLESLWDQPQRISGKCQHTSWETKAHGDRVCCDCGDMIVTGWDD